MRDHKIKNSLLLAWPIMLANLALPLLGLIDTAILGHLDDSYYLAAIAIATGLFTYVIWGFNFLSMGISGFSSNALGQNNSDLSFNILIRYLKIALTLGVTVIALHWLILDKAINWMTSDQQIVQGAAIYLHIRIFSTPFILITQSILAWFVGRHKTKISLWVQLIVISTNIFLDVIFVLGFGWNIVGVALGTLFAEILGCLIAGFFAVKELKKIKPKQLDLTQNIGFGRIFSVSHHIWVRSFLLLTVFLLFNRQAAQLGKDLLAANAILISFLHVIAALLDGFAAAAEAQVGKALGAKDKKQLTDGLASTGALSVSVMLFLCAIFWLAGPWFISLLTNQQNLIILANEYLIWLVLLPLAASLSYWLDGVFVGMQQSRQMRNAIAIPFFIFYLPAFWFYPATNNHLLWSYLITFMVLRTIMMLGLLKLNLNQKR